MDSFYGGLAGKPFYISQIFSNKMALVADLQLRWISPVMPGEYVIISYGSYSVYSSDDESKTQYQTNYEIDYPVYKRNYNGTLWEKIYYEPTEEDIQNLIDDDFTVNPDPGGTGFELITDGSGITFLMSGCETIFYSRDYGLGYKLITSMTGNTPTLSVADPTIILGPLEDPNVTLDDTDVNNPELQFYLPRAVKFFFGSLLGQDVMPQVDLIYEVDASEMPEGIELGDYYINRDTGYIFLLQSIEQPLLRFEYKACFQPPAPESLYDVLNPYYKEDGSDIWESNYPRIEFLKIPNGWRAVYSTPKLPELTVGDVSFIGSLEIGEITGEPISETQYAFNFSVPGGPKFFAGNEVAGDNETSASIYGARWGDYYINSDFTSPYNGFLYLLQEDNLWHYMGNIKGATGDALKIKVTYTIGPQQVSENTLETVGTWLTNLGVSLDTDELAVITYVDGSGEDISYWYYQLEGQWYRVRVTGGLYSILEDSYVPDTQEGSIYTTRYINNLIVSDDSAAADPERNTYNINTINKLISEATILWNDFW